MRLARRDGSGLVYSHPPHSSPPPPPPSAEMDLVVFGSDNTSDHPPGRPSYRASKNALAFYASSRRLYSFSPAVLRRGGELGSLSRIGGWRAVYGVGVSSAAPESTLKPTPFAVFVFREGIRFC